MNAEKKQRKIEYIKRQLFSLTLTILSFVCLITSTYAWFVSNREINAKQSQLEMTSSIRDAEIVFYPVTNINESNGIKRFTYLTTERVTEIPTNFSDPAGILFGKYKDVIVGKISFSKDTDVQEVSLTAKNRGEWKDVTNENPSVNYISNCLKVTSVNCNESDGVGIAEYSESSKFFVSVSEENGTKIFEKSDISLGTTSASSFYFVLEYNKDNDFMDHFADVNTPNVNFENDIYFTLEEVY